MLDYIIQCLIKSKNVIMDSNNRERFLSDRRIVEMSQMDGSMLKDYAVGRRRPPPLIHL